MTRGAYQIEIAAGDEDGHYDVADRIAAWCQAWGVTCRIYRPVQSEFGARVCFDLAGLADAFLAELGGRLLNAAEVEAARPADDEEDADLEEAEQAHFETYVLHHPVDDRWDA